MSILEFVARTFSPRLPDGRLVFRPWGGAGPCYLLSARQRTARAWIQLAYYGLAGAGFWLFVESMRDIVAFGIVFALLNYVLYWLFSIGLPKTATPPPLTPEQRRAVLAAHSRDIGRPLLWCFLLVSCAFALGGAAMALFLDEPLIGLLSMVFFSGFAAFFTWQLRLTRKKNDA